MITSVMLWNEPNNLSHWNSQMDRLGAFDVTLTLCFTPPSMGRRACYTSPSPDLEESGRFAIQVVTRYVVQPSEGVPMRGERSLYEQDPARNRGARQLCQQSASGH